MKRFVLITAGVAALAVTLPAQDDADYQTWMKTTGATVGSLKKNLEAKNADASAADAKKLQEVFGQVQDYWRKKSVDDAVKFAASAGEGFGEIAADASASKFDEATAAFKQASASCGGCHAAHREKLADGTSKIK